MSYKKLLNELETMSKSLPAIEDDKDKDKDKDVDDKSLPDGAAGDELIVDNAGDDTDDDDLTKSMTVVKLDDGSEAQAFDGEELIKSFNSKLNKQAVSVGEVFTAQNKLIKTLADTVTSQAEMMKSMQVSIDEVGNSGKGRKTVVNLQEKPDLNKSLENGSEQLGIKPHEFHGLLTKALKAKVITPHEATTAETLINSGRNPSEEVVAKVMGQ